MTLLKSISLKYYNNFSMSSKGKKELKKEIVPAITEKQIHRKIVTFFFVLCFIIYGKSIGNKYAMDDEYVIHNNIQVHKGIKAIPEIFKTTYIIDDQNSSYEYRPLVKVFYAIEYQLFGEKPGISHFINILLYAITISFLFFLLLKLFPNYHYVFSLTIATFFLIHPLHSEVVMSIKNRDELLSFFGCLLSLYFYLKFTETDKKINIFFGAFFMLFALLSKKDSMTFFAIIPVTIWFFRSLPLKKYGLIFMSFLLPLLLFRLGSRNVSNDISRIVLEWENPLFQNTSILHRIPTGFYTIYFYVKMYLIPHPLLSYYGYNQVPIASWTNPIVWMVILGLIPLVYFAIKNIKTNKTLVYGMFYFFTAISMFTNILKPVVGIVGERFAYIPSLGLCIISAWGLFKLFSIPIENIKAKLSSFNSMFFFTISIIILIYGGRTFARNSAWKDTYTLYKTDVENASESAHAHSLFAAASIQKIRENSEMSNEEKRLHVSNAIKHYQEALRIIPNYISCLNNLGMVYYTYYNKAEEGIPYLKKAIQLKPDYVEAYFNLATCHLALKHYDEAEKMYLESIKLNPKFINTYYPLSNLYLEKKQFDKILELNQNAINIGIKSDILYINMGNAYFIKGDTLSAVPFFEKGIELTPGNRKLNSFLAQFFQEKGNFKKASYYYDLMSRSGK